MDADGTISGRLDAGSVVDRLRRALPEAMKARDLAAVAALRSALAAIANAEAVDGARAPRPDAGDHQIAGTVVGLGAAEVERRTLTDDQIEALVRAEVADRLAAAAEYERGGQTERAGRLRAEAAALGAQLGGAASAAAMRRVGTGDQTSTEG